MGLPTLRQILELPAFSQAELLSGQSRLENPVTWVHVAEVLDVARLLSGGELLLSTGLELSRAAPEARMAYVRSLAEAGVVGLGLELVQWLKEVPLEVLHTAQTLQFPILAFRTEVRFADLAQRGALEGATTPATRVVYCESPANPNMRLVDLQRAAALCRQHGAKLVVDNTCCTPCLRRPLELGAHVVAYSATRYLNGHGDVTAGLAV